MSVPRLYSRVSGAFETPTHRASVRSHHVHLAGEEETTARVLLDALSSATDMADIVDVAPTFVTFLWAPAQT